MATPETLVEGHEEEWHTVALAGTKRIGIVDESEVQKMQNWNIYDVWDEKTYTNSNMLPTIYESACGVLPQRLMKQNHRHLWPVS